MTTVTVGILRQVLLVVFFGIIEFWRLNDLSRDRRTSASVGERTEVSYNRRLSLALLTRVLDGNS